ncbi:unnamed protein product [Brachionus calyciflorus]|uniref:Uncharacterized protein n=1 Tax=Brachionus calyciflorus TaxID=104777 RepID=A0A813R463_9BILA|nr:unnamed protein product [Brachionus calyciflorus]
MIVSVCATYSHGNPVRGDFELKAFTNKFSYKTYKEEVEKIRTYSKKSAKGCVDFEVKLSDLDIGEMSFIYRINFEGKVTEDKTNIVMNKTSDASISFNNFDVEFDEPKYYKPGFKTYFKLRLKNGENNGYSNEKVKVTFEKNSKIFYKNSLITDNNGNLDFTYDPNNDCTDCAQLNGIDKPETFYIKVRQASNEKNLESNPVTPWFTEKNSYLSIEKPLNSKILTCGQTVKSKIVAKLPDSSKMFKTLHFNLQSRSGFVLIGQYDIYTESSHTKKYDFNGKPNFEHDEYSFDLKFDLIPEMSPQMNLLVYYVYDNEIIPDTLTLNLEKCLSNKVDLELSQTSARPSRLFNFTISAEPNSLCAFSSIDKSITFLGNRNNVDKNKIFNVLSKFELSDWVYNSYKSSKDCPRDNYFYPYPRPSFDNVISNRARKSIIYPGFGSQYFDPTKSFSQAKIVYLSDLKIYKNCAFYPYAVMPKLFGLYGMGVSNSRFKEFNRKADTQYQVASMNVPQPLINNAQVVEDEVLISSIRQFFPETWLWSIETSDEKGLIKKREKTPDSITDWLMDAYCLSNKAGLGVSETKTLKVFQPLFVSVNLPYSVIRGEIFPVFATVFNYETTCIPTVLEIIGDSGLAFVNTKTEIMCVCPDEEKTHQFNLKALDFSNDKEFKIYVKIKSLNDPNDVCDAGKVTKRIRFYDSEIKTLVVEPEGIPKEQVKSSLFIFKDKNQVVTNQLVNMTLPSNIIPKSSRVYLRVTGDAIGAVLNNLDNLVQQPTGCGEQNMVKFAPIVFIADYLKETDQLNDKIQSVIQNYLKIGYQRQLTYRHNDGSFSAFGSSSSSEGGGTWLTAFVLRCFSDSYASKHIQIDPKDLEMSFKMLLNTQSTDGSFKQVGAPLYSKALAGGLKDKKVGLSAYVLISLLKANKSLNKINVEPEIQLSLSKGIGYLSSAIEDVSNTDSYTLALALYAFKIAELNEELISKIDSELDKRASKEGDFIYWKETQEQEGENNFNSKSADLEITSYILTARLFKTENLADLVPIAKWINSNRNSLGGFYSTQDTVVALEALTKFASLSFSKNVNLRLDYNLNGQKQSYFINNFNRLTAYSKKLDQFKEGEENVLSFDLNGYGTVLVEIIFKYNLIEEKLLKSENNFDFSIAPTETERSNCNFVRLKVNARKNGEEDSNGMVIVGLRLPTGWEPVEESVKVLEDTHDLRRFELKENKLSLYFDELTPKGKNFEIEAVKKFEIKDVKPGHLYVYDYYEPLGKFFSEFQV